jgi:hypothetical protein
MLAAAAIAPAATIRVPEDQPTIADALAIAVPGDIILVQEDVFYNEPDIDWGYKAVRIESIQDIYQPVGGLYSLASGATVASAPGDQLEIRGELRSPTAGSGDAHAGMFRVRDEGGITVLPGARLNIVAASTTRIEGSTSVEDAGVLAISMGMYEDADHDGSMILLEEALLSVSTGLDQVGTITGFGAQVLVAGSAANSGVWTMDGGRISANQGLENNSSGVLTLYGGELNAGPSCYNVGTMRVFDGLVFAGNIDNYGELSLLNTDVVAVWLHNDGYNDLVGNGFWVTDLNNDGLFLCIDDTTIVGDVVNSVEGTIRIQAGTLTIMGSLTNDGTIIGDYSNVRGEPNQVNVGGDLVAGYSAGLFMPDPTSRLRVDGEFDVAIYDNERYNMVRATLLLGSLYGSSVTAEVMSTNIGPDPAGLDRTQPGHFPLGKLHIAGSTITLVDVHDNDMHGWEQAEALYVDTLQIDAGATLITNGLRVYYETLINEGSVDDAENLIQIGAEIPGDLNGDGCVDQSDLGLLLAAYGIDAGGDLDGDDDTDQADLGILLAHWWEGCR